MPRNLRANLVRSSAHPLKMRGLGVVLCLCACLVGAQHADASAEPPRWTPDAFPNPMVDTKACGRAGFASRICDPDAVLTTQDSADVVEGIIRDIESAEEPYRKSPCDEAGSQGYQVPPPPPPPTATSRVCSAFNKVE